MLFRPRTVASAACVAALSFTTSVAATCDSATFPHPSRFGLTVTSLSATEVIDYVPNSLALLGQNKPREANFSEPISFCNITITYTHPGYGNDIHVYVWLPPADVWNSRFMAIGGGGYASAIPDTLPVAVSAGYVGAHTDGGNNMWDPTQTFTPEDWALLSPGNVDWARLQVLMSRSLDDMTHIAKQVIESFYGTEPEYSYFNGCSNGGRQAMMLAQRYPKNYDGILANAPAIDLDLIIMSLFWGPLQTQIQGYVPPLCELDAITAAAVESCDELDGVKDGVIANLESCTFDAMDAVGRPACDGSRTVSEAAALIANTTFAGPKRNERIPLLSHPYQAPFNGPLNSTCDANNENCAPLPFGMSPAWITYFLAKNAEFNPLNITEAEYFRFVHLSQQEFASIVGTSDPDLTEFRAEGGKLLTWHGLSDQLISPANTARYYDLVEEIDPQVRDFYRYFEAPGVEHCAGGIGAYPAEAFNSLVDWVESGKAPDKLDAASVGAPGGSSFTRPLCPYPQVAQYIGGDTHLASSFRCADDFGSSDQN